MQDAERERFFASAAGVSRYLSVEVQGAVYLVRTEDQNVGRSLFVGRTRGELRVLGRAVRLIRAARGDASVAGRQFIDVGANIGTSTIPALLEHGFGSAICLEPESRNVLTLRVNLLLNGLEDRAGVLPVAASRADGSAQLVVDPTQGGKPWIASAGRLRGRLGARRMRGKRSVSVPTVALDTLVDHGRIDPDDVGLLWMDAQGHEGHILQGAGRLVRPGVPVVLEWDPRELARAGSASALEEIAESHYTHFADLRPNPDPAAAADFELRPTRALEAYADVLGRRFTDLLLLRLQPSVAAGLDVSALLAERSPA